MRHPPRGQRVCRESERPGVCSPVGHGTENRARALATPRPNQGPGPIGLAPLPIVRRGINPVGRIAASRLGTMTIRPAADFQRASSGPDLHHPASVSGSGCGSLSARRPGPCPGGSRSSKGRSSRVGERPPTPGRGPYAGTGASARRSTSVVAQLSSPTRLSGHRRYASSSRPAFQPRSAPRARPSSR
jgi:hypothetical protein